MREDETETELSSVYSISSPFSIEIETGTGTELERLDSVTESIRDLTISSETQRVESLLQRPSSNQCEYTNDKTKEKAFWCHKDAHKEKDDISSKTYSRHRLKVKEFLHALVGGNLDVALETLERTMQDLKSLKNSSCPSVVNDAEVHQLFENVKDFLDNPINRRRKTLVHQQVIDGVMIAISWDHQLKNKKEFVQIS